MDYLFFKTRCKECGTTPTALSLKIGLSKGNTSSWKKGGNPSVEVLIKIADELNCTVDRLLGRNFTSKNAEIELYKSHLTENEQDVLNIFNEFTQREQIEVIGTMKYILKDYKSKRMIN